MTNKITGYRELTNMEVDRINKIKDLAVNVGSVMEGFESDESESTGYVDKRWLAIAKTDLQKGFMALTRSIAKPTTF